MRLGSNVAVILVSALIGAPAPSVAQEPVREFAQLNTRLVPGDTVWVTDAQGREVKGRILSLGPDALALEGGGRTYGPANVATIQVRRADSLRNGALIGFAVGGGLGLGLGDFSGSWSWGDAAVGALMIGGIGAGIGVGIDALIPGKKLVAYRAPGSAGQAHARFSIAPVITPRAKGVAVAFAF